MTDARPRNSSTEAPKNQGTSRWEFPRKPGPQEISRLLNLREIEQEFGLTEYHVYRAVHDGHLHAVQRDGKGRIYYAEWEVRGILKFLYDQLGTAA